MMVDTVDSPVNTVVVTDSDVTRHQNTEKGGDMIGDVTYWPSLSESTRVKSDSDSLAPAILQLPENYKHLDTSTTQNSNSNRSRTFGRGGSGRGGSSRGGFIRHTPPSQQLPPPPPLPPAFFGGFEGPIRGPFFYGSNFGPHPRSTDHQFPQSRGGGRRYSNGNYRGPPMGFQMPPQQGPPMGYAMPPQSVVPFPFMHPPIPPEPFMGIPPYNGGVHAPVNPPPSSLSPPPPPPPPPNDLGIKLMNQINYYFSDENLVKDMYLRSQMDDGGWVPVALIANFNKVKELTQDIQFILETLGGSAVVEVNGDKLRRRNDWRKWIPSALIVKEPATNGLNTIMRCLQKVTLEEVHAIDRSSASVTTASSSPRVVLT